VRVRVARRHRDCRLVGLRGGQELAAPLVSRVRSHFARLAALIDGAARRQTPMTHSTEGLGGLRALHTLVACERPVLCWPACPCSSGDGSRVRAGIPLKRGAVRAPEGAPLATVRQVLAIWTRTLGSRESDQARSAAPQVRSYQVAQVCDHESELADTSERLSAVRAELAAIRTG
jgi:hypothetical protein